MNSIAVFSSICTVIDQSSFVIFPFHNDIFALKRIIYNLCGHGWGGGIDKCQYYLFIEMKP